MNEKKWTKVAEHSIGGWGQPGSQGCETTATLYQRGKRWRCCVQEVWGNNQGYHEEHGRNETEGRGTSPEEAIEACRKDVFAWANTDKFRAELATLLRKVCYEVEDGLTIEQAEG